MKKRLMWLLALVAMVVSVFSLVACGGKKEGVYKFYSMKTETTPGMTVELKVGETFLGMITLSEDFITLELKEDGSYVVTAAGNLFDSEAGTWQVNEEDSGKIDMTVGGVTTTVECDGKTICIEQDGAQITLKK